VDRLSLSEVEESVVYDALVTEGNRNLHHPETEPPLPAVSTEVSRSPNRVFIVHGQNEKARNSVVAFLESVGLAGVVLHEQPNIVWMKSWRESGNWAVARDMIDDILAGSLAK